MRPGWIHYAVYRAPSDFPEWPFVIRQWIVGDGRKDPEPNPIACLCRSRREVEDGIPRDLVWIPRAEADDPVVVGVFL